MSLDLSDIGYRISAGHGSVVDGECVTLTELSFCLVADIDGIKCLMVCCRGYLSLLRVFPLGIPFSVGLAAYTRELVAITFLWRYAKPLFGVVV